MNLTMALGAWVSDPRSSARTLTYHAVFLKAYAGRGIASDIRADEHGANGGRAGKEPKNQNKT